ncbi:MAG: FeoC-like transcriptional regulator [Actinomycetota bacterium]|nr:FeoC-like transcriptional regulator [Actinomycetota bacterium]
MTVLDRVVEELRSAKGPIRLHDLAVRVGVERSALDGMLGVLVEKGRLTSSETHPITEEFACTGCGKGCVGLDECPWIVDVPVVLTVQSQESRVKNREADPRAPILGGTCQHS